MRLKARGQSMSHAIYQIRNPGVTADPFQMDSQQWLGILANHINNREAQFHLLRPAIAIGLKISRKVTSMGIELDVLQLYQRVPGDIPPEFHLPRKTEGQPGRQA